MYEVVRKIFVIPGIGFEAVTFEVVGIPGIGCEAGMSGVGAHSPSPYIQFETRLIHCPNILNNSLFQNIRGDAKQPLLFNLSVHRSALPILQSIIAHR